MPKQTVTARFANSALIGDIKEIFFNEIQLDEIVARLGRQISKDFEGKNLLMVSVLKGSVVFMADLMRHITIPCRIDFISSSIYKNKTMAQPRPDIRDILQFDDISMFDILVVEDILDTGRTLQGLSEYLLDKGAKSVTICTLLDKPERRDKNVKIKPTYIGATVANEFVVGYGLDFDQVHRNLPYIGILKPEVYKD